MKNKIKGEIAADNIPKGSVIVGLESGKNLKNEINGVVILGDHIYDLDKSQKDVVFLGDRVVIGKTIGGVKCNLYDILTNFILEKKKSGKAKETLKFPTDKKIHEK